MKQKIADMKKAALQKKLAIENQLQQAHNVSGQIGEPGAEEGGDMPEQPAGAKEEGKTDDGKAKPLS